MGLPYCPRAAVTSSETPIVGMRPYTEGNFDPKGAGHRHLSTMLRRPEVRIGRLPLTNDD
jgi:hypothetical protein